MNKGIRLVFMVGMLIVSLALIFTSLSADGGPFAKAQVRRDGQRISDLLSLQRKLWLLKQKAGKAWSLPTSLAPSVLSDIELKQFVDPQGRPYGYRTARSLQAGVLSDAFEVEVKFEKSSKAYEKLGYRLLKGISFEAGVSWILLKPKDTTDEVWFSGNPRDWSLGTP